jgi:hypothetical protein
MANYGTEGRATARVVQGGGVDTCDSFSVASVTILKVTEEK